jgi:hypothetical protein
LSVQDYPLATASGTFSITINAVPTLGALSTTAWTVNQPGFSSTVSVSGGTTPIGNLSATGLPAGLSATQSGNIITISGTPTTTATFNNIQLSVQDSTGATSTGTYSMTINAAPTLGSLSTTVWTANQSGFSSTVSDLGGTTPISNLIATGLPPGLSATQSGNTITISGTPTTIGTYSNIQLTVRDTTGATASGTYSIIIVGPAVTLSLTSNPIVMAAGTPGSFTVTALDSSGNAAISYRGTVSFSSSDGAATLPAPYTFTAADSGVHTFTFTLRTAGAQLLYARDPNGINNGSGQQINVAPSAADHFQISAPPYAYSFYGFNVTASVVDAYNNPITGYTGTVHFTSSDAAAVLPADYSFTASDQGSHTFPVTLETGGSQTITATDTSISAVNGAATVQDYAAIPGLHFHISAPPSTTAGSPFSFTVTALDQNNQLASHYVGTMNLWFGGQSSGCGRAHLQQRLHVIHGRQSLDRGRRQQ